MYMYVCVCVYVYMCVCIYIYIYVHVCTYYIYRSSHSYLVVQPGKDSPTSTNGHNAVVRPLLDDILGDQDLKAADVGLPQARLQGLWDGRSKKEEGGQSMIGINVMHIYIHRPRQTQGGARQGIILLTLVSDQYHLGWH